MTLNINSLTAAEQITAQTLLCSSNIGIIPNKTAKIIFARLPINSWNDLKSIPTLGQKSNRFKLLTTIFYIGSKDSKADFLPISFSMEREIELLEAKMDNFHNLFITDAEREEAKRQIRRMGGKLVDVNDYY